MLPWGLLVVRVRVLVRVLGLGWTEQRLLVVWKDWRAEEKRQGEQVVVVVLSRTKERSKE